MPWNPTRWAVPWPISPWPPGCPWWARLALLFLFLRSLRRPLVQILALIIGLCWTFGLVTLVVGRLNLLSMIFAPLMLGLTIDYGIHYFCRLEEEQSGGKSCTFAILACTYQRTAPGHLLCRIGRGPVLRAPDLYGL